MFEQLGWIRGCHPLPPFSPAWLPGSGPILPGVWLLNSPLTEPCGWRMLPVLRQLVDSVLCFPLTGVGG